MQHKYGNQSEHGAHKIQQTVTVTQEVTSYIGTFVFETELELNEHLSHQTCSIMDTVRLSCIINISQSTPWLQGSIFPVDCSSLEDAIYKGCSNVDGVALIESFRSMYIKLDLDKKGFFSSLFVDSCSQS